MHMNMVGTQRDYDGRPMELHSTCCFLTCSQSIRGDRINLYHLCFCGGQQQEHEAVEVPWGGEGVVPENMGFGIRWEQCECWCPYLPVLRAGYITSEPPPL